MADVGIKINAFDNTKTAFDSVGRGLGTIHTSAASVAGALASIGVGVSIGGFMAMTKQIMDGLDAMNDLKDATGASIENISALEDVALRTGASFDTVSTALVKLNQGLNSAKSGSDTEAAIKAIGLSVKDLKALDPAEAFQKIAVGLSGFADDANKARIVQELFGKSLKEVAPLLKDVAENGKLNGTVTTAQAEAAEKLNKQIFNLQKNALDLGRAFTSSVIPALSDGIDRFILAHKHAGSLLGVLSMYARLDTSKSIQGNLGEVEAKLATLEQRAAAMTAAGQRHGTGAMIADLKAEAAYLKDLRMQKVLAEQGDNSDAVSRRYMTPKATIGEIDTAATKAKEAAAAKALSEMNRELAAQAKLMAENAGLTGTFAEDWGRLTKIFEKGGYNLQQLTEAQAKLLAAQPGVKAFNDAEVKAAEAVEKARVAAADARQKYAAGLAADLGKLQEESTAMQDYVDRLGLSKVAVAELDAQRLESQATTQDLIVLKKIEQGLDESQYEIYVKMAAELRKQAALKRQGSIGEAQLDVEKEITAERKRGWEATDNLARSVFASWATEGGNAAQKIGDTLEKALLSAIYEATLQPVVFDVYTSITGGKSSAGNAGTAGATGSPSAMSWMTNFQGNATLSIERLGESMINAGSETLNSVGKALLNNSSQIGKFASNGAALINYLNAADMWRQGKRGAAAGAAIGQYFGGPIGSAIGQAIGSKLDYTVDPKGNGITATIGATGVTNGKVGAYQEYQQTGGLFGGGTTTNRDWAVADKSVSNYIDKNVEAITAANRAYASVLGLTSDKIDGFTKNIEVNLTGLDAAGQKAAIDAELTKFAADQSAAAYSDAVKSFARDGETTSATVARLATDLGGVNGAFAALGYTLYDVSAAGAAAASGLASAFGSLAAMQSQTAALYNNYYTQAEQKAYTVSSVAANLGAAGITGFTKDDIANASREQIRAVVDQYAGKVGTATGDKQYAAIVAAANALTAYVPAFADAAKAVAAPAAPAGSTGGGGGGGSPAPDTALSAWQDATDAIVETMADLRSALVGEGPNSFAKLQAQFVIETAKAKAGDLAAAQDLPELAKSLADANKANATSSVQQAIFTARIVETLGSVAGLGNLGRSISVPAFAAGGLHAGGWAMVGENGPELVNMPSARVYNAQDTRAMLGGQDNAALVEELRAVRAELAAIKAYAGSSAASGRSMAQVLDGAANGQKPLATEAV